MSVAGTTSSEHSPQLGWAYVSFVYQMMAEGTLEFASIGIHVLPKHSLT